MRIGYSEEPTPWAVTCREHGLVYMVRELYMDQLFAVNSKWVCPICFREASWSDENYDAHCEREMAERDMPGGFN
jgi:hypothetical protein